MAGALNLVVLFELALSNPHLPGLVQALHLHRAPKVGAGSRNGIEGVSLAEDEHPLVIQVFRALAELTRQANLVALSRFIANVRNQRAHKGKGLSCQRSQRRT